MKIRRAVLVLSVPLLVLGGCASRGTSDEELACAGGAVSGAAVGGLVGNQFGEGRGNTVMTAVGALAGGAIGANAACQ